MTIELAVTSNSNMTVSLPNLGFSKLDEMVLQALIASVEKAGGRRSITISLWDLSEDIGLGASEEAVRQVEDCLFTLVSKPVDLIDGALSYMGHLINSLEYSSKSNSTCVVDLNPKIVVDGRAYGVQADFSSLESFYHAGVAEEKKARKIEMEPSRPLRRAKDK